MATKRTATTIPRRQVPTVKTILSLIKRLSRAQRKRLFKLLADHPDNETIKREREVNRIVQEVVLEEFEDRDAERRRSRRGPEYKKRRTAALLAAIRQAIETGTPRNPEAILETLRRRDDADQLVYRQRKGQRKLLSPKTIANLLPRIK
jgi:hypothetical protein